MKCTVIVFRRRWALFNFKNLLIHVYIVAVIRPSFWHMTGSAATGIRALNIPAQCLPRMDGSLYQIHDFLSYLNLMWILEFDGQDSWSAYIGVLQLFAEVNINTSCCAKPMILTADNVSLPSRSKKIIDEEQKRTYFQSLKVILRLNNIPL